MNRTGENHISRRFGITFMVSSLSLGKWKDHRLLDSNRSSFESRLHIEHMTLVKLLNFAQPQFPHLQNVISNIYFTEEY